MKKKILSMAIAGTVIFTGLSGTMNTNQAHAIKKGTVVTIDGQSYKYGGKYNHYFTKADCKAIAKTAGKINSISSFVGGTSGFTAGLKKSGYAGAAASSVYLFNLGVQKNLSIYKTAKKKGTGVQVSYDMYYPVAGPNIVRSKNYKVVYK